MSMVLYAASPDLTSFYIHISRLAIHTENILADPRASLMICESWEEGQDPQTLARVSMQGHAGQIKPEEDRYWKAKSAYLVKNPRAEHNFELDDFGLFEFRADKARFVGGFGRIIDLDMEDLGRIASERG